MHLRARHVDVAQVSRHKVLRGNCGVPSLTASAAVQKCVAASVFLTHRPAAVVLHLSNVGRVPSARERLAAGDLPDLVRVLRLTDPGRIRVAPEELRLDGDRLVPAPVLLPHDLARHRVDPAAVLLRNLQHRDRLRLV